MQQQENSAGGGQQQQQNGASYHEDERELATDVITTPRNARVTSFIHGRLVLPSSSQSPSPSSHASHGEDSDSGSGNTGEAIRSATGRIIIIGDVHGCLDELETLLSTAKYGEGDVVIMVGDLVNKGPKSAQVDKEGDDADADKDEVMT